MLNLLTQDYVGGRTVFVLADGKVAVPDRTQGRATIHTCNVPHAVTHLEKGVRYSLFFLQME